MKTIVILGLGYAGTLLTHRLMSSLVSNNKDVRLIVVSPNTHLHWALAIPRAVVPGQLTDDQVMAPLESRFKKYQADRLELVAGAASALDPEAKTVEVALNDGAGTRTLAYDVLVVASGSSVKGDVPFKPIGSTENTKKLLHAVRDQITAAKTIVVAGGGVTGVETAGEIGFEYAKSGKKEVYLVHRDDLPLDSAFFTVGVRSFVKAELEKLNVKLVPQASVKGTPRSADGKDVNVELEMADGSKRTIAAQAYLPAIGLSPNTSFAPAEMLDTERRMKQDAQTLRATGYDNIFIAGDAGNLQTIRALNAEAQAAHLGKSIAAYVEGGEAGLLAVPPYKAVEQPVGMTIGRSRGTAQVSGFRVPSFFIWWAKGRTMTVEKMPAYADLGKTIM